MQSAFAFTRDSKQTTDSIHDEVERILRGHFVRSPTHLPEFIIVIDFRELYLYRVEPGPVALIIDHLDLEHDSQTNVPIVEWNSPGNACTRIANWINQALERYHTAEWGLACPRTIRDKCLSNLRPLYGEALIMDVDSTFEKIDLSNVIARFEAHLNH